MKKEIMRLVGNLVVTGIVIGIGIGIMLLIYLIPITYEEIELSQRLRRQGNYSSVQEQIAVVMYIMLVITAVTLIVSLRIITLRLCNILRQIKRQKLESLSYFSLKREIFRRVKKVHKLDKDERFEIFDSLTDLSLEDLKDIIPSVWHGLV